MEATTPTQPHSKIHTWIIVLLGWIVVLSLATLVLTFGKNDGASADDVSTACQDAVNSSIVENATAIADSCLAALEEGKPEGNDEPESVSASSTMVGFEYPSDWTAAMRDTTYESRQSFTTHLDPGFIFFCDGCDGPMVPITIRTEAKDPAVAANFGSYKGYWQQIYAESTSYPSVTNSETVMSNGTLYTFSGRANGLGGPADFEALHFEGATWVATVFFDEFDDGDEYDDAWELVKNSLDFSLIQ